MDGTNKAIDSSHRFNDKVPKKREGEKVYLDPPTPSPWHAQHLPPQSDPDVDQTQRQANKQEAILRVPAGCPGSGLIHHPVAAFNPEAATVFLAHIRDGTTQISYDNIWQVFHLVLAPFALGITTHNLKVHLLASVFGTYHRVGGLIAFSPLAEAPHTLPVNLGRDYAWERLSLKEADDLYSIEVSVQIQAG